MRKIGIAIGTLAIIIALLYFIYSIYNYEDKEVLDKKDINQINVIEEQYENKTYKGNINEQIRKLRKSFEKALKDILDEYDELGNKLEVLRNEGKTKTTKFRELLGKKLVYNMIITIFKRYGLVDK